MSQRLAGKVAIVTGGASGIGRATCHLVGREGAVVLVTDIDEPGGRAVADEVTRAGSRAAFLRLDVTQAGFVTGTELVIDGGMTAR